jgi:hypothetical protein
LFGCDLVLNHYFKQTLKPRLVFGVMLCSKIHKQYKLCNLRCGMTAVRGQPVEKHWSTIGYVYVDYFHFLNIFNNLKPNGKYTYHLIQRSITLLLCYGFSIILSVNRDCFLKQHSAVNICNVKVLGFLCGAH